MTNQHSGAEGSPGLCPPPGFENLASSRGTEAGDGSAAPAPEEQSSSTLSSSSSARGPVLGLKLFPFPSARDSPQSPLASTTSADSGRSTRPEVSSEYSDREKMENTNAFFFGHHHQQVVAMMIKKFGDLLDYDKTGNRKILHIDWIAGNSNDPIKKEGSNAAHSGMSAEDRRLSESVARSVMRITHGVSQWDETTTWNKAMFFGDWITDHKGLRQFFIEIQVKRISGADDALLEKCGISPEYVWLSLHDDKAPALTPIVVPPLVPPQLCSQAPPRQLPIPVQTRCAPIPEAEEEIPTVEQEEFAAPAPTTMLETPTCSADKGKGKAPTPQDQTTSVTQAPPIVSSGPAQPPQPRPLPDIANLALGQQAEVDPTPSTVGPSAPRTGIPRSQPLPNTGSFDSLNNPAESDPSISTDGSGSSSSYEDEGTVYLAANANPFDALLPAHQTPASSAADLARHRQELDRIASAKREELKRVFHFLTDPSFIERKTKSFVYAVRVVAVPDRGAVVNPLVGPRADDRYGTLICQGGWVVPPLEERVEWRDEHKRVYRNKGAKSGRYEGLPRPQVQYAMPVRLDWSGGLEPRYYGPAAPVWREVCDPCLEDVYWMVWQLVGGRQFLGFNPGAGMGVPRREAAGDEALLGQCPFKSPSAEALFHAASYPRGKEH